VIEELLMARHRREVTDGLAGIDLTDDLGEIRLPVRVVSGSADPAISTARAAAIASCFPNARLHVLNRRGHAIPLEDPSAVLHHVDDLVNGLPR
jgi:pimeloyl-ACP methyl ester carboxylesterase